MSLHLTTEPVNMPCMWSNILGDKYMLTLGAYLISLEAYLKFGGLSSQGEIHQVREAKICGHIAIHTT